MDQRKRLIELLCAVECKGDDRREGGCGFRQDDQCNRINKLDMCMIECVASYLLANGVIVPPVKVGETVYGIAQPCGGCKAFNEVMTEEYLKMCQKCDQFEIIEVAFDYELIPEWGKTVFLTEEEAMRNQKNKLSWSEFKGALDDGKISEADLKAMYDAYIDDGATE